MLFYRSLLGLVPLQSQELASPNGLIRSQALAGEAAGESVRLVLNVPVLGGGRAVERPLQHVAIRSADIVETARAVSAQGLPVLPVPGNYYEDLAARLGLDAASLETYRRCNILYDEDSAGRVTAPLLRHLRPGRRAVRDRRPRARLHGLRSGERARSHGRPGNRVMRLRGE